MRGDGRKHEARKLRARIDHHAHRAETEDQVAQRHGCRRTHRRLDLRRVGRQPRDDLAGLIDVEERGRELHDACEDVAPEIGDDALAERDHEVIAGGTGKGEDHCKHHQHGEIGVDEAGIGIGEAVIDHPANGQRQGQRGGRCNGQRDGSADREAAVTREIRQHGCERAYGPARRRLFFLSWHRAPRSPVTGPQPCAPPRRQSCATAICCRPGPVPIRRTMQRSQVFRAALVIPQTFMYRHGIELGSRGPRAVCGFIYVFGPKVAMPCDNWTLEL